MKFSDEQNDCLKAPLSRDNVKTRDQGGKKLSYIEGWVVIKEANRIFGFGGWNRETILLQETNRTLVDLKSNGGAYQQWRVGYIAKVRLTVGDVVREGTGYGSGMAKPEALGDAVEGAIKEAETDAMKRGFMTFGNPFGLALYDKEQSGVEQNAPAVHEVPKTIASDINEAMQKARKWAEESIAHIRKMSPAELTAWEGKNAQALVRLKGIDEIAHRKVIAAMQDCDGLAAAE